MTPDMIEKRLKIIEDLSIELKSIKTHFDEMLENDASFQKTKEELDKVKEDAKGKREKILANSMVKSVMEQLKEKRQEIKENKEALSQELIEYYRESGSMEILDADGNVKRLKFSVKLVS
jgi:prefoldin subunit 5